MKISLLLFLLLAPILALRAGESGLTRTIQPLDGMASGEIVLASVMCHDRGYLSGLPTDIGLITAKNVPPTNAPKPVEDINVASACGLVLSYSEDSNHRGIVTLDCRALHVPQRLGCTELQAVGATLECLRQVAGSKMDSMRLAITLKSSGQEAVQKLFDAFTTHPKDKPFPWQ